MIQKMPTHDPQVCGFDRDSTCANCRWFHFPHDADVESLQINVIRLCGIIPRPLSEPEKELELQRLANLALACATDSEFARRYKHAAAELRGAMELKIKAAASDDV